MHHITKKTRSIFSRSYPTTAPTKPRVLVLGTGWSSFRFLRNTKTDDYEIFCCSPRNHFLFTPLLASTTVGTLDFRTIIQSARSDKGDFQFYQAHATAIDFDKKEVVCVEKENTFKLTYDKLIIGIGCRNNTFGIPGVEEHAYFLKELSHARAIRGKIIQLFERSSLPNKTPQERKEMLHFVVVGGGPTGIEFTAEFSDFFWQDIERYFPELNPDDVHVTLLEASHNILSSFDRNLVGRAMNNLKNRGVSIRTDTLVKEVTPKGVLLGDGTFLQCGMVIWSTGVGPRDLTKSLNLPKTPQGRILVDDHLRVLGHKDVYAFGDCAQSETQPLPCTAQVAEQQGKYLAKVFSNPGYDKPFDFRFRGLLLYTGGYQAVLDAPWYHRFGFISWLLWRSVYLTTLGSYKNKFQVPAEWLKTLLFGRDVTNFETSEDEESRKVPRIL